MTISLRPVPGKFLFAIMAILLITVHLVSADRMAKFLRRIHSEDDDEFRWGKGFGKNGKGILRIKDIYFGKGDDVKGDYGKGYDGKGDYGKGYDGKGDHNVNHGKSDCGKGGYGKAGKGETGSLVPCPTSSPTPSGEPNASLNPMADPSFSPTSSPTAETSAGPRVSAPAVVIPLEDEDVFDSSKGFGNVFDSGKGFGKDGVGISGIGKGKGHFGNSDGKGKSLLI